MTDAVETEWQFEAEELERVAAWLAAPRVASLSLVPTVEHVQVDGYFDTADWRLHRAGWSLRRRQSEGVTELTLKALEHTSRGVAAATSRREITEPIEGIEDIAEIECGDVTALVRGAAGGAVGECVRLLVDHRILRALFDIRTRRRTYEVRYARVDARLATVELDESTITAPGASAVTLRRVEVELVADRPNAISDVEAFVAAMARDCLLRPAATSKFVAGLAAAGLNPAEATGFGPTAGTR